MYKLILQNCLNSGEQLLVYEREEKVFINLSEHHNSVLKEV